MKPVQKDPSGSNGKAMHSNTMYPNNTPIFRIVGSFVEPETSFIGNENDSDDPDTNPKHKREWRVQGATEPAAVGE